MAPNKPSHTPPRSVRVPNELWRAAQSRAAERGQTVTDVIVQALERYVMSNRAKERLGTISEARDALGLLDAAEVWQWVAAGRLLAERDDSTRPQTWIVYRTTPVSRSQA